MARYPKGTRKCPICKNVVMQTRFSVQGKGKIPYCIYCYRDYISKLGTKRNPNKTERRVFLTNKWMHTKNLLACFDEWGRTQEYTNDWKHFRKALRYMGGSIQGEKIYPDRKYYQMGLDKLHHLLCPMSKWNRKFPPNEDGFIPIYSVEKNSYGKTHL